MDACDWCPCAKNNMTCGAWMPVFGTKQNIGLGGIDGCAWCPIAEHNMWVLGSDPTNKNVSGELPL